MADANNEPFVNVALVGDSGRGSWGQLDGLSFTFAHVNVMVSAFFNVQHFEKLKFWQVIAFSKDV